MSTLREIAKALGINSNPARYRVVEKGGGVALQKNQGTRQRASWTTIDTATHADAVTQFAPQMTPFTLPDRGR